MWMGTGWSCNGSPMVVDRNIHEGNIHKDNIHKDNIDPEYRQVVRIVVRIINYYHRQIVSYITFR